MKSNNQIKNEGENILNRALESEATKAKSAPPPKEFDATAYKLQKAQENAELERGYKAERDSERENS